VNCTGLGARSLFSDTELTPIKGQLTYLLPYKGPPRTSLPKHTAVQIDPAILDKYVGEYSVPGGQKIVLIIRREGNHLSVQENDEPKQDLLPESETQFFSTLADDVYRFEMDESGRVTRMVLHTDGQDVRISRQR
jgi:hypothetical protein